MINKFDTQLKDKDGDSADIISTNGYKGLVAIAPGHVSTVNSTSDILGPDETFTGEWEDTTNFGVIQVTVKASHASATDGLVIEFSPDGINCDTDDKYTVPADKGKPYSAQAALKYFRVKYTNSGTQQTYMRLQSILKPYYVKPSSHRIQDTIIDDDDGELIISVLKLRTAADTYVSGSATAQGNFKVSLEEYESDTNPVRSNLEGGGKVAVGTTAVEVTFTGTTKSIIITADRDNTGVLYVGKSNVTSAGANAFTFLEVGDSIIINYDDTDNAVYVVASAASQNFWKGALL